MIVDTTGIDRAELFAALYNQAAPRGMGWLDYTPEPMSKAEAALAIETVRDGRACRFDYWKGRVIKTDVLQHHIDPRMYDRDNGQGALSSVVEGLRRSVPTGDDDDG